MTARSRIASVLFLSLSLQVAGCAPSKPLAASRLDYLGQTDGRRCEDLPLQDVGRMPTDGHYMFLIDASGHELPFATITLQELPVKAQPTTLWRQRRVPRDAEDQRFAVFVPATFLPNQRYQFILAEDLKGKETVIGRFAFTLTAAGAQKGTPNTTWRPCDSL